MCGEIYEDLEQRYQDLMDLSSLIPKITDDENMRKLYFILLQASLFSEAGISTLELLDLLQVSRPTLIKRLDEIADKDLLIWTMIEKKKYYQLNIEELDKQRM